MLLELYSRKTHNLAGQIRNRAAGDEGEERPVETNNEAALPLKRRRIDRGQRDDDTRPDGEKTHAKKCNKKKRHSNWQTEANATGFAKKAGDAGRKC